MAMTKAASTRAREERVVRIILIVTVVPILPLAAFLVWLLGYDVHPHRVTSALIIAAVFVVVMTPSQVFLHRLRMKGIARRYAAQDTQELG